MDYPIWFGNISMHAHLNLNFLDTMSSIVYLVGFNTNKCYQAQTYKHVANLTS